jgi:hypothetical protein
MEIRRQYALSLLFVLALAPHSAFGMPADGLDATPGRPLAAGRHLAVNWSQPSETQLQPVAADWRQVASVHLSAAADRHDTGHLPGDGVRTGPLSWSITAEGTVLTDTRNGLRAHVPELSSNNVRPRDLVYDPSSATVWLYGGQLYRYRLERHTLERLALGKDGWQTLRKIALGRSGLWLAAGDGIYLLDAADGRLKRALLPGVQGVGMVNLTAAGKDVWFATSDARLVHVYANAEGRHLAANSPALPGIPAEMAVAGNSLWLLMAGRHGDYYLLGSLAGDHHRLDLFPGRYYTLSSRHRQVVASAYSMTYTIDPAANTVTPAKLTATDALLRAARNTAVLYAGSSYDVRDGCEVVEHAQLDISKGWTTAMGEPAPR